MDTCAIHVPSGEILLDGPSCSLALFCSSTFTTQHVKTSGQQGNCHPTAAAAAAAVEVHVFSTWPFSLSLSLSPLFFLVASKMSARRDGSLSVVRGRCLDGCVWEAVKLSRDGKRRRKLHFSRGVDSKVDRWLNKIIWTSSLFYAELWLARVSG
jgi:hypothetical protein